MPRTVLDLAESNAPPDSPAPRRRIARIHARPKLVFGSESQLGLQEESWEGLVHCDAHVAIILVRSGAHASRHRGSNRQYADGVSG